MTTLTPLSAFDRNLDWMNRFFASAMRPGAGTHVRTHAGAFPIELKETDTAYVIFAELPGFKNEDIDVSLEDNVLTIRAEKKHDETAEGERYHFSERGYGEFSRAIRLPRHAAGEASAHLENGILTLTINKVEEARPRRIEIQ
ncbi:Hsp20/alpha crystallin family protein [Oceanidesulfovibrio marinus]|uniref:Hsp20/alpha crystallin family protein n=1 Tax=Oceanidesulfovibrio marinus TaxID=370038 RepID=A0A6P1ZHT2_9BACT|nr:Hsp20/alpha crystallin family protein [Oceanidesulfovibrio marinus]QJT10374.1 Hsp20/alpha crystallin family protein [Oceanidesulfovibrio marinus]TVM32322.1 Hsp20/alpha crystallin family protein [Oceanidesulfovibrio marinus]